jgi:type I restriction enzyme S subunit
MAYSQSNYGIKPKYGYCYFFTYLLIDHCVNALNSAAYGSVFDTITTRTFKSLEIKIPSETEIVLFDNSVKDLFVRKLNNCIQIQTLTNLRDTLLPKLMSGEVRVHPVK